MKKQENNFLVSDDELFELARFLKPEKTSLAILPRKEPSVPSGVEEEYRQLPVKDRDELNIIVRGLASPVRLLRLHYSIVDETISRQLIIWPGASDEVITLARNGNLWRVGRNTEFGVRSLIEEILGAGSNLRRDPFALQLSSTAVLVFMGIMEQMKYSRLYSTLVSRAPVEIFSPMEILDRIRESVKEDFRWPLAMFEKIIPVKLVEMFEAGDVAEGLKELTKLDLVEVCDEKGNVLELSPAGEMVADSLLHEVSKAAICVSQCREDGIIGHDVDLMVRSSFYLFLFEIAGEAGVIAALDAEEIDEFLKKTMEIPDEATVKSAARKTAEETWAAAVPLTENVARPAEAPKQQTTPPAAAQLAKTCSKCGKPLKASARFCPGCGQAVSESKPAAESPELGAASLCPHCGKPVKVGVKFCRNCGKPLV